MSLSKKETLEISTPTPPPGFPPLVRERLRDLGPGEIVDRDALRDLCGTASAANQFLHKAKDHGLLVPVAWGRHRVADADTLDLLARMGHPVHRRFLAWARLLPDHADRPVSFLAPWFWTRTDLNLDRPMPVLTLDPDDAAVDGAPPQWDAFFLDAGEAQPWDLVLGGEAVVEFTTPTLPDALLVVKAGLDAADPRWHAAATRLEQELPATARAAVRDALDGLSLSVAPRGHRSHHLGTGPPHRRRLLVPPWYMEAVHEGLTRITKRLDEVRRTAGDARGA